MNAEITAEIGKLRIEINDAREEIQKTQSSVLSVVSCLLQSNLAISNIAYHYQAGSVETFESVRSQLLELNDRMKALVVELKSIRAK